MIKLKQLISESFYKLPSELKPNAPIAPDQSLSALIQYMKETYNMDFVRYEKGTGTGNQGEYVFRRDDGRFFFYTIKDLRYLGAPLGMSSMYAKPKDRMQRKYVKKRPWRNRE